MQRDLSRNPGVRRKGTYNRLVRSKHVGFLATVALLFNAATGPGLPFAPANFQNPGIAFTGLCYLIMMFVSAYASLFIVEAMQALPGNRHFQGDVEYATMINFYFDQNSHILGQFMLYGALQSTAIQGIVLSSQAIDKLFVDIFKKACGIALTGDHPGWRCVATQGTGPSPFGDDLMLFTLGFFVKHRIFNKKVVICLTIPLGISDMDNNMVIQYVAFVFSVLMIAQWNSSALINGLDTSNLKIQTPVTLNDYGSVVGNVMLNFAITTIIPSWINIKDKNVNVQQAIWCSLSVISLFYVATGILMALGFSNLGSNVLSTLLQYGSPKILCQITVYLFAFVMLIPSIPVNLIISKENLVQNDIVNDKIATFVSLILPWFISIPFLGGDKLQSFQNWTSLIFVSSSSFIIPVIIYFQCLKFRRQYNNDNILSVKQYDLLIKIHANSKALVKHIRQKSSSEQAGSIISSPSSVPKTDTMFSEGNPSVESKPNLSNEPNELEELHGLKPAELNRVRVSRRVVTPNEPPRAINMQTHPFLHDDVPDPDMDDLLEAQALGNGTAPSNNSFMPNLFTLARKKTTASSVKPSSILPTIGSPSPSLNNSKNLVASDSPHGISHTLESLEVSNKSSEVVRNLSIQKDHSGSPFSIEIQAQPEKEVSQLYRLKTLPTHPNFITPAFRSVPKWMPFRGEHMAWLVLILTLGITLTNIGLNLTN
ncbi:hypothetical protein BC833DRAFT_616838 [Globomyces pollinis-pini]|nr:hypothetical protein BC833DRAFT_616838 [Globomyces pollinis-pini]